MVTRLLMSATVTLALGAVAAGCAPTGGDDPSVGNKAINKTLTRLTADLLSQATNLHLSITDGATIASPNAMQPTVDRDIVLSGSTDDGSSLQVTVQVATTVPTETGANSVGLAIFDTASGFTNGLFIEGRIDNGDALVGYRTPPLGFAGIDDVTGEGQAFIIVSLDWLGAIYRYYYEQTVGTGLTLVNMGPFSPLVDGGLRQGTFARYEEYLVEYEIVDNLGTLEAHVVAIRLINHAYSFRRSGGPAQTVVQQSYSQISVDAVVQDLALDVVIPVGVDADPASTFTDTSTLDVDFSVQGGVTSGDLVSDFSGVVNPVPATDTDSSVSYSGNLAATAAANGIIEADESVVITTRSVEDPTAGDIVHSVDAILAPFENLQDLLYLTSQADQETSLLIFR